MLISHMKEPDTRGNGKNRNNSADRKLQHAWNRRSSVLVKREAVEL